MGLYDDNAQGALSQQSGGGMLDPNNQALLSFAAAMMQAGGASAHPVGLGQAFGQGLSKSMEAYKLAQQEAQQRLAMQAQLNKLQKDAQAQEMFTKMYSGGPSAAAGGTQQNPSVVLTDQARANLPSAPQQQGPALADIGRLMGVDPERGKAALLLWQQMNPDLKFEGGVALNPKSGQPIAGAPPIPQTNPQGFSTQNIYGPEGFRVGVTPGSLDAFRAQQRETNRYNFEPVKLASGATVPVSKVDLAEGKGPLESRPPVPAPAPRPMAPKPSLAPIKNDPWSKIPMRFAPTGVGQSTYNEGLSKAQAEMSSKLQEKFGEEATGNGQRMALNNQALEMVDKSDTGTGAASLADVKKVLVTRFGIPESSFENTPSATAILQKDLMNAAVQKAKQSYGSRMTQMEVTQMLSRGAPNVDMTKAAMKYLLAADNATMQYGIQRSQDLGRYISAGGDPHRFESWYATNFPMSKDLGKVRLDTGSRPPLSAFQK